MKLATFDLFDTLILRPYATPRDVWGAVEMKLGQVAWAEARSRAEEIARAKQAGGEPDIAEIHACLPPGAQDGALEVELEQEMRCWVANRRMLREVERLRDDGWRVGFLSDTYFRESDLRPWLEGQGIARLGDPIWVSCELRASKHSGRVFEKVRQLAGMPVEWVHFGDNPESDVRRAREVGVDAQLVETGPSKRECSVQSVNPLAAARLRAARLSGRAGSDDLRDWACAWAVFPHAFLKWVRRQVQEQGADLVCFLARDGQVLHRMAGATLEGVPTVYLPASRRAWRFAAAATDEAAFADWLRLGHDASRARSLLPPSLEGAMPASAEWHAWVKNHREDVLLPAMRRQAANVLRFWEQNGLLDARRPVFVDLGWSGSLQRSAERLWAPLGASKGLLGLYVGLFTQGEPNRRGWAFEGPSVAPRVRHGVSALELLCVADHGTLLEHSAEGQPVWANLSEAEASQARDVQQAILDGACALGDMEFDPRPLLGNWLGRATASEVRALGGTAFSPWAFSGETPPPLSPRRLVRLMTTRHRHLDEWPWPALSLREVFPSTPDGVLRALLKLREATWPADA